MLGQNYKIEGLMGMQLYQKTVSIIGCGKIGKCMARICKGFGMKILINDIAKMPEDFMKEVGAKQVDLDTALKSADVLTVHTPLDTKTKYLINKTSIAKMKKGVLIVNVARGPIVNTSDLIEGIKSRQVGGYCADVMEGEGDWYFGDHSTNIVTHDNLCRLMQFHNVVLTSHQGALYREAQAEISRITLGNVIDLKTKGSTPNQVA